MKNAYKYLVFLSICAVSYQCKKDKLEDTIFEINEVKLYPSASAKLKEKTESQWIAVVYTNLFQQALQALARLPYNTESLADFATFIIKRSH